MHKLIELMTQKRKVLSPDSFIVLGRGRARFQETVLADVNAPCLLNNCNDWVPHLYKRKKIPQNSHVNEKGSKSNLLDPAVHNLGNVKICVSKLNTSKKSTHWGNEAIYL